MPHFETKIQNKKGCFIKQKRNYSDIIKYLDTHWSSPSPEIIITIDKLLGNISNSISSIIISGTSGKSTTIHYLTKLLHAEGLKVGSFSSPHFTQYNERLSINNQLISDETFVQLANTVLDLVDTHNLIASSKDILTAISLLYFKQEKVDVALFEYEEYKQAKAIILGTPSIVGITRIVTDSQNQTNLITNNILEHVTTNTHVIAADQSKILLQEIHSKVNAKKGTWIMPIRKVAPLPYPFEQLHGRCAALAERIAQTYIEYYFTNHNTNSLLKAPKKQQGRPNLKIKQLPSTNQSSMEEFWQTVDTTILSNFQIVRNKKSTILLDNAYNIDALQNLLLGIRLLNYKRPFKNIYFIFGCHDQQFNNNEFIKVMRYFLKKISGKLALYSTATTIGEQSGNTWDTEKIALHIKSAKTSVATSDSFKQAYDLFIKQLHDPQDLLVITGSQTVISEYWKLHHD